MVKKGERSTLTGNKAWVVTALIAAFIITLSVVDTSSAATAKLNYRFYCAACHGLKGRGDGPNATSTQPVHPRDHTNGARMSRLSDSEIVNAIKLGGAATNISRMMPPFEYTLTEKEIKALKDYLRELCKCREGEG